MTQIAAFEKACADAGVSPVEVLTRAGLHRATWFRWKGETSSPNMKSFDAAQAALEAIKVERADKGEPERLRA
jgi:hypothetical protein